MYACASLLTKATKKTLKYWKPLTKNNFSACNTCMACMHLVMYSSTPHPLVTPHCCVHCCCWHKHVKMNRKKLRQHFQGRVQSRLNPWLLICRKHFIYIHLKFWIFDFARHCNYENNRKSQNTLYISFKVDQHKHGEKRGWAEIPHYFLWGDNPAMNLLSGGKIFALPMQTMPSRHGGFHGLREL